MAAATDGSLTASGNTGPVASVAPAEMPLTPLHRPRLRRRPLLRAPVWGVAMVVAVAAGACSVPAVDSPIAAADGAADGSTDTADVEAPGPELVGCTKATEQLDCPAGMLCETTARVCVDCVVSEARCNGIGERILCDAPEATGEGELTGGFEYVEACSSTRSCVDATAECEPRICEAGLTRCAGPLRAERCAPGGTAWLPVECPPGGGCYEGQCLPIRHNVLVIVDTSGSMNDYVDGPGGPYRCNDVDPEDCAQLVAPPQCEYPFFKHTLLTLAKQAFTEEFNASLGVTAQLALQRFAQVEDANRPGNCGPGWYSATGTLTGDDDRFVTVPGDYYDQHWRDVVAVPFPSRADSSNRDELLEWFDRDETLAPTSMPCEHGADCPSGLCATLADGKGRRCMTHDNHELRASSLTPLGKSLFYAGEYYRRHVAVDGRACEDTSDCGSTGYVCEEGACVDVYAGCRDHYIVVFTDGGETQNVDVMNDFFNPVVQAKRLKYGLGCTGDEDCRGGATCDEGVCVTPGYPPDAARMFDATGAAGALSAADGTPLSITTVFMSVQRGASPAVPAAVTAAALWGGGPVIHVALSDLDDVQAKLASVLKPKSKCTPDR